MENTEIRGLIESMESVLESMSIQELLLVQVSVTKAMTKVLMP